MTMRHFSLTRIPAGLALALVLAYLLATPWRPFPWAVLLSAQTFTHNTTTLAADQAAADTTISLTAVTAATGSSFGAVQAGQMILVDGELETFVSVTATSTVWNVQRRGARTLHKSGTTVYIGVPGSFQSADPSPGGCVAGSQPKFWINVSGTAAAYASSGRIFTCGPNGVWALGQAPWMTPFQSGNGATVTLTAAQSGQTLLFDRAAGIVYTLPAPFPGLTFDFVQTVTVTSNSAEVAVATAASQFMQGIVHIGISGGATGSDWACNGTSHVAIKQNGTTAGGILGGRLHFVAVSTTIWQVDGLTIGSGTEITPCSTTV